MKTFHNFLIALIILLLVSLIESLYRLLGIETIN